MFELGYLIAQVARSRELFGATDPIRESLGDIHADLVHLVGRIAIVYRQRISGMTTSTVSIDFDGEFGPAIRRIWSAKDRLTRNVWKQQLHVKQCHADLDFVQRRLSPVEPSIKSLIKGRLADKSERAEGTCVWVQSHLLDFLRSSDNVLTISGAAGTGKSMLASWMKERLQRPLGRVAYEALSYTFSE